MSDILLTTFKDFLNAENETIDKRYFGDSEFNRFKKYLIWRRAVFGWGFNALSFLFAICISSVICIIVYFLKENIFETDRFYHITMILFIALALFIFSLNNLLNLYKNIGRFELVYNKINRFKKGILWNKWHSKEIIFNKPILLQEKSGSKVSYSIKNNKPYSVCLILQYPAGHFGWYCITNQMPFKKNKKWELHKYEEITIKDASGKCKRITKIKHFEKGFFKRGSFSESHNNILKEMVREFTKYYDKKKEKVLEMYPTSIVGLKIRTTIQNNKVTLYNLRLE